MKKYIIKTFGRYLLIVLVGVSLAFGIVGATKIKYSQDDDVRALQHLSGETLKYSINKMGDLITAEYMFTHVESFDSDKRQVMGFSVPGTKSTFIYSIDGMVNAGIDFEKIDISRDGWVITVKLPQAEIKDCTVDDKTVQIYDEKNNIFNPVEVKDVFASVNNLKEYEKAKAIERGLLTTANENAKRLIENFIRSTYNSEEYFNTEGYEIIFVEEDDDISEASTENTGAVEGTEDLSSKEEG